MSGTDASQQFSYTVAGVECRKVTAECGYVGSEFGQKYYWCRWEGAELAICSPPNWFDGWDEIERCVGYGR